MSLREGKPRLALLCCSLALSPSSREQQQPSSSLSPSSSAPLPAAIRAAATYNAFLASLAMEEDEEGGGRERIERTAEELEALAKSLDDDSSEGGEREEGVKEPSAAARHPFLVLGRRARARVWLRAAEALARVAAAAAAEGNEEGGGEEGEKKLWGRASAAASRAVALSSPLSPSSPSAAAAADAGSDEPPSDPRCRAAALALVAASETRLGRVLKAREAIRQALDLGGGGGESRKDSPLLPGARAALDSYLRAIGS